MVQALCHRLLLMACLFNGYDPKGRQLVPPGLLRETVSYVQRLGGGQARVLVVFEDLDRNANSGSQLASMRLVFSAPSRQGATTTDNMGRATFADAPWTRACDRLVIIAERCGGAPRPSRVRRFESAG